MAFFNGTPNPVPEDILDQPILIVDVRVMQSTDVTSNFTSELRGGRRKGDANYVEDVIYCSPLLVIVTSALQLVLCPTACYSRHHISHYNSSDSIITLP